MTELVNFDELSKINQTNADKQLAEQRHGELINSDMQLSQTVVSAFASLIQYLEGHTSKTQVVNQLRSIGTPDALQVIPYIQELHQTIKGFKNTDLSEVTKLMSEMVSEAKKIPKEIPKSEKQQFIDYSKQFAGLKDAIESVGKFVKEQKLIAEAPIVTYEAPDINIEAPDLEPLQTSLKDVVTAVEKIIIPEFKTDNTALETLVKKSNELLKKIIDKPVSSGGGGGGVVSFVGSSGYAQPVTLTADGRVPVDVDMAAEGIATSDNQTNGNQKVQGNVAAGAADSGNPVKVGAIYNSTQPTFANGQRTDLQSDTRGNLKSTLFANNTNTPVIFSADNADAVAVSATANKMGLLSRNTVFNGSTWDRMRQPVFPATTSTVYNITLTNANTEYSQALPAGTKQVFIKCQTLYDIRYAWATGKVATPTAPYRTIGAGLSIGIDAVSLTSTTLYLASSQAGVIVEIEVLV